ncbi:hypothetical protein PR048_002523 [Dryococelus australis]|uniref:Uncharacterized protein n=1 Tax=Dryococelus australis TaxID=614101 RepID=A0ABQ9IKJ9_9NEOP|nr:hypothetical protein PR048_002523 [Dryococelus australis]
MVYAYGNNKKSSIARIMGFNRVQLKHYFDSLESFIRTHTFHPVESITWTKLIESSKGTRNVNKAVTADKGQPISIACVMSATGLYIPPALIFARKLQNPALMHEAPSGSVSFVSDHGYMTVSVFVEWLHHFKSQYEIADIFGQAFARVATLDIAANAFRTCAIVPLNRYIFTDVDFLPLEATDQNFEISFDEIDTEDR